MQTNLESIIFAFKELIALLEQIKSQNWGLTGLPSIIDPIIEAAVESITLLANALSEGTPFWRRNPELLFSETKQDALGNPLQSKITREIPIAWSEPLSDWLYDIASYLIEFKRLLLEHGFHGRFQESKLPKKPGIQVPENPRNVRTSSKLPQKSNRLQKEERRGRSRHYFWLRRTKAGQRQPKKHK
jgi:hypothetical protein